MFVRCANRNRACNTHCLKIKRCGRQVGIAVLGMLLSLVAALPAARAQIVPVSLAREAAEDSKIPRGNVPTPLPPLPREVRRAVQPGCPNRIGC
jgi:hypothetical protein